MCFLPPVLLFNNFLYQAALKDFCKNAKSHPCPARSVVCRRAALSSWGTFTGPSALLAFLFRKRPAACSPGLPTLLPICAFQRLPSSWRVLSPDLRTRNASFHFSKPYSVLTLCLKSLLRTPNRDNHPSLYFPLCR